VEVLITLVIMALVTGLLFEGIGGAAQMSLRLSDEADRLDRNALAADWWRASVVSALPPAKDPQSPDAPRTPTFIGAVDAVSMETVATLHARLGAPRLVRWTLAPVGSTTQLIYEADGVRWTAAQTRKRNARFVYRDVDGSWKDAWNQADPPQLVTLENFFDTPVVAHPRSRAVAFQPPERPTVGL